jgi:sulfur carrier protein
MKIHINGEVRELKERTTLDDLVRSLDLGGQKVAVELNSTVVGRGDGGDSVLKEDHRREIVHFVGGG